LRVLPPSKEQSGTLILTACEDWFFM